MCIRCGSPDVVVRHVDEHDVNHCICNECLAEWVE